MEPCVVVDSVAFYNLKNELRIRETWGSHCSLRFPASSLLFTTIFVGWRWLKKKANTLFCALFDFCASSSSGPGSTAWTFCHLSDSCHPNWEIALWTEILEKPASWLTKGVREGSWRGRGNVLVLPSTWPQPNSNTTRFKNDSCAAGPPSFNGFNYSNVRGLFSYHNTS